MTLLGVADRIPVIFLAYGVAAAGWAIVIPLAESHALHGLPARGRTYGPVRLWGSVAFIVANLGAGWLVGRIAREQLVWIIVAGYWATVGAAALIRGADAAPPTSAAQEPEESRLGARLVLVLAASSLIQGSHSMVYGFSSLQWSAAGLSGFVIGALWAVGVTAEILLFAYAARLPAALASPFTLLLIGAGAGVLRWGGLALDPPAAWLPLLQALHGLSFGAAHLGAVQFVARTAAPGRAATAQGLLAWTNGLAMAGAMMVSGFLYARFGPAGYVAMAALAATGGLCALIARTSETNPTKRA
jgi:PPP family 3-phenylpropionic acid transporter